MQALQEPVCHNTGRPFEMKLVPRSETTASVICSECGNELDVVSV